MTENNLSNYGRFHEILFLHDADHELLVKLRYDQTHLGFAVQLGTLRFTGR
jgi:hypothetical protein